MKRMTSNARLPIIVTNPLKKSEALNNIYMFALNERFCQFLRGLLSFYSLAYSINTRMTDAVYFLTYVRKKYGTLWNVVGGFFFI